MLLVIKKAEEKEGNNTYFTVCNAYFAVYNTNGVMRR